MEFLWKSRGNNSILLEYYFTNGCIMNRDNNNLNCIYLPFIDFFILPLIFIKVSRSWGTYMMYELGNWGLGQATCSFLHARIQKLFIRRIRGIMLFSRCPMSISESLLCELNNFGSLNFLKLISSIECFN